MDKTLLDISWLITCAGLVFMMQAGFLCLETGLTRTKNAINVAIKNVTDFCVSVFLYWLFGFALMFGVTQTGWFGTTYFFASVGPGDAWFSSFFLFQAMFCATATTIVSGAVAERMRFSAYLIITIIISGFIYPIFGHWAWGGLYSGAKGWLAHRGFIDFAGSTVVHSVGGWVALAALLVVGPRQGRFSSKGTPRRIPGSNLPIALLGVLILFFGWIGFNGGSTLTMSIQVPGIIVNTVLGGISGGVVTLIVGWRLRGFPDVILPMNGALAGLVSVTANCFAINASSAVIIGSVGGIVMLTIDKILERFKIDDVIGAVPVHAGAGIWGTLALGLFGNPDILNTGLNRWEQVQIQFYGIFACGLFAFGTAYLVFFITNRFFPLRVTSEEEFDGLNVSEHEASSELVDLLRNMEEHIQTQDVSQRIMEEPFTEVGQIAKQYNRVLDSLETMIKQVKSIANNISNGILSFGTDGVLLSFNPAAERILGINKKDVIGEQVSDILLKFLPDDQQKVVLPIQQKSYDEIVGQTIEVNGNTMQGEHRDVEFTLDKGETDDSVFYTAIIQDITIRKESERKLIKANTQLQYRENEISKMYEDLKESHEQLKQAQGQILQSEKMASIGQLAAGVAHEINNPVGFINSNMEVLNEYIESYMKVLRVVEALKGEIKEKNIDKAQAIVNELIVLEQDLNLDYINNDVNDLLKHSQKGIERIRKIVMDLRTFAREDKDTFESVKVEEVIDSILSIVSSELKHKAELKKDYGETSFIKCNSQKLGQVFINLFVNAFQAIEKRGDVKVSTYQEDGYVCVDISDTGEGIAEENLKKIFDAFYTTKPVGEGTGLGLSISYEIVKKHKGDIKVESKVGEGTTFTIMLPVN